MNLRALCLASVAALSALASGCGSVSFCDVAGCEFTKEEWSELQKLADFKDPPPADPSNKYVGSEAAAALGQKFYWDTRFSGAATLQDTLRRNTQYARSAKGVQTEISCATCHLPARAGTDFTSQPGHVSVGAGWYDVNSQQTVNAAYYDIIYWNGRNDSLWAQIIAVNESPVSMNSTRLKDAWRIADKYATEYNAVFTDYPLPAPFSGGSAAYATSLGGIDTDGQCLVFAHGAGTCPPGCLNIAKDASTAAATTSNGFVCIPAVPPQGKPGATAGCQAGSPTEPFLDAFDCASASARNDANRIYVNFAKAIASYEYRLISRNSAFDQFVEEGSLSEKISPAAKRGARLFVGKASCIECHSGGFFSDQGFHNVGVPQVGAAVPTVEDCYAGNPACDCVQGRACLPWGAYDGLQKLQGFTGSNFTVAANGFKKTSTWSDDPSDARSSAYYTVELNDRLKGAWRTPSLRDAALTAPYMHDGAYATLEDVVWHYNIGGASSGFPGEKSVQIRPLHLTDQEQADLVEFLHTLTGEGVIPQYANSPAGIPGP